MENIFGKDIKKILLGSLVAGAAVAGILFSIYTNNRQINKNRQDAELQNYSTISYFENIIYDGYFSKGYLESNVLTYKYFDLKKIYIDGIEEVSVYDNNSYSSRLEEVIYIVGKDTIHYYSKDINNHTAKGQVLKTLFEKWNKEYNDMRLEYAILNKEQFPGLFEKIYGINKERPVLVKL